MSHAKGAPVKRQSYYLINDPIISQQGRREHQFFDPWRPNEQHRPRDPRDGNRPARRHKSLIPRFAKSHDNKRQATISGVLLIGFDSSLDKFDLRRNIRPMTKGDVSLTVYEHPTFNVSLRFAKLDAPSSSLAKLLVRQLHDQQLGGFTLSACLDYDDQLVSQLLQNAVRQYTNMAGDDRLPPTPGGALMPCLRRYLSPSALVALKPILTNGQQAPAAPEPEPDGDGISPTTPMSEATTPLDWVTLHKQQEERDRAGMVAPEMDQPEDMDIAGDSPRSPLPAPAQQGGWTGWAQLKAPEAASGWQSVVKGDETEDDPTDNARDTSQPVSGWAAVVNPPPPPPETASGQNGTHDQPLINDDDDNELDINVRLSRCVTVISALYPGTTFRQIRNLFGGPDAVADIYRQADRAMVVEFKNSAAADKAIAELSGDTSISASLLLRLSELDDLPAHLRPEPAADEPGEIHADNRDKHDNTDKYDQYDSDEDGEVVLPEDVARIRQQLIDAVLARIEAAVVKGIQRLVRRDVIEPTIEHVAKSVYNERLERRKRLEQQRQRDIDIRDKAAIFSVPIRGARPRMHASKPRPKGGLTKKNARVQPEDSSDLHHNTDNKPRRRTVVSSDEGDMSEVDYDDNDDYDDNTEAFQNAGLMQDDGDRAPIKRTYESSEDSDSDDNEHVQEDGSLEANGTARQTAMDIAQDRPQSAADEETRRQEAIIAARKEALTAARSAPLSLSVETSPSERQQALQQLLTTMSAEDIEFAILAMQERKADPLISNLPLQYHIPPLLRAMHVCTLNQQTNAAKRPALQAQSHTEGCARAQGYYFVSSKDKRAKLTAGRQHTQARATTRHASRDTRRKARHMTSELMRAGIEDVAMELNKFNQLKVRKKRLAFARSKIHDWGLFAMEAISKDAVVIEYVGEAIRQSVADERERRYTAVNIGSSYLFRIDETTIIDATRKGSIARFMNHSCEPNCWAQVVTVQNENRIVIYASRDIDIGEEITYDYKFPADEKKIPCTCGAENCRGFLN
eukprot:TRINITY_DN9103_c0_g1_i1.p1 TRINITY_DN9103_c0_g1~~TRINITY_DN9103_c0_g1_i1.p1  ORF type:complete len:1025 (+),score=232.02 TRINITY_DN9103_c0_g1_i1:14-3088(+)